MIFMEIEIHSSLRRSIEKGRKFCPWKDLEHNEWDLSNDEEQNNRKTYSPKLGMVGSSEE